MRGLLMCGVAAATVLIGPSALADATTDRAVMDLIERPRVCGPGGATADGAPVAGMVMVDGFGSGGFPVDTANPEAQAWFDHGVRLRWAFEHVDFVSQWLRSPIRSGRTLRPWRPRRRHSTRRG